MSLKNQIVCGDCLEILPKLPKATMIFADPPDNIGVKYEGFNDSFKSNFHYAEWLNERLRAALRITSIFWVSINKNNLWYMWHDLVHIYGPILQYRQFIWHFTFGQHRNNDCGNDYRPILRLLRKDAILYPDAIRTPSARQIKYNDKRANPDGRVPGDVWEFPRVCGTFKERKKWHPCQHPKELLKRMVLFSTKPGDLVIDMFAGSFSMAEVCKELGRDCISIEISKYYCEKGAEILGCKIETI